MLINLEVINTINKIKKQYKILQNYLVTQNLHNIFFDHVYMISTFTLLKKAIIYCIFRK